jgi:hypothetical protein
MWPKYIYVSFNFAWTVWIFQYIYLQTCICHMVPILRLPVVTSEIHSYLQNSKSTFFLIYHYDYRQHTTSQVLIQWSLKIIQHLHTTYHVLFHSHRYTTSTVMQYHLRTPTFRQVYSTDHSYRSHRDSVAMYLSCCSAKYPWDSNTT